MNSLRTEAVVVRVGIAEGAVAHAPTRLRTTGLGSCVGVVLFDAFAGVSGLVHVMLPSVVTPVNLTPAKYAESGVPWLMEKLSELGATPTRVKAKLAGGAQMFAFAGKSDIMRVGPRNVEAVKEALLQMGVPIVAEDVGGSVGRTIEFDVTTQELWIRTAMRGPYAI
jgi:chemotaxis protein CheD